MKRKRSLPDGWYPGETADCLNTIKEFSDKPSPAGKFQAGILPHASWAYSGKLAARVMDAVSRSEKPDLVVMFGGHLGPGKGIIYLDQSWDTPLGDLEIDLELTSEIKNRLDLISEDGPTNDNTIEVQLPLVKYYFPDAKLIAVRAPHDRSAIELGRELALLIKEKGLKARYFGSTDLTHYGPNYGFSPMGSGEKALTWVKETNDREFIDHALGMDAAGLLLSAKERSNACSPGAAAAVISASLVHGAKNGLLLDYYTSNEITPGSSFVGYAGVLY